MGTVTVHMAVEDYREVESLNVKDGIEWLAAGGDGLSMSWGLAHRAVSQIKSGTARVEFHRGVANITIS